MNTNPVNRVDAALAASSSALMPTSRCPIGIRRRTLNSSGLGRVEDFSAPGDYPAPCGHSPQYQLVLPYAGAFEWHVGAKTVFLDGTRVLFVSAREDYADRHVAGCGHDSSIITPRLFNAP